jgi:hypothetical protein
MKKNNLIYVIVSILMLSILLSCSNPLKKYEALKNPQVKTMADQKMLTVSIQGDPSTESQKALGALFGMFYNMKKVQQGLKLGAVRARWDFPADMPKDKWKGVYAIPLTDSVSDTQVTDKATGIEIKVETWKYGDVVEVLHIGPYSEEKPTVDKIMDFAKASGYKVVGPHEEEYIKGPGMIFKGDPKNYLTIIRYRVEKEGSPLGAGKSIRTTTQGGGS